MHTKSLHSCIPWSSDKVSEELKIYNSESYRELLKQRRVVSWKKKNSFEQRLIIFHIFISPIRGPHKNFQLFLVINSTRCKVCQKFLWIQSCRTFGVIHLWCSKKWPILWPIHALHWHKWKIALLFKKQNPQTHEKFQDPLFLFYVDVINECSLNQNYQNIRRWLNYTDLLEYAHHQFFAAFFWIAEFLFWNFHSFK